MNENFKKFQLTPNQPSQKKSNLKLIFFITLFAVLVSVVIGFLVFKDQDQTYSEYLEGEVTVIFNDFDLTENEIQNFLDEYDLTLTKETVEYFDSARSLGVIAVKVPRGQEEEYKQILKKSPLVENVVFNWLFDPL